MTATERKEINVQIRTMVVSELELNQDVRTCIYDFIEFGNQQRLWDAVNMLKKRYNTLSPIMEAAK